VDAIYNLSNDLDSSLSDGLTGLDESVSGGISDLDDTLGTGLEDLKDGIELVIETTPGLKFRS